MYEGPSGPAAGNPEKDDLNRVRFKVRLAFSLPRGGYATMLIKRLALTAWQTSFER